MHALSVGAPAASPQTRPQSSNQRAIQGIARDILGRAKGDRLETTLYYQQALGVGAGTVQKALRLMENAGAASLRPAGHQGTFVESRNLGILWSLAELGHVRVCLPPPGAAEHYGLAAGLMEEFSKLEVPAAQQYVPGAERRMRMVRAGSAEVAVVSRGAASRVLARGETGWNLFDLGNQSYYRLDSLLVVSRPPPRPRRGSAAPRRIGIDRSSYDHEQLTLAEFPEAEGHTYVDGDYSQVPTAILEDRIDAGVWHRLLLLIPLHLVGLRTRQLERDSSRELAESLSNAVLMCRTDNNVVANVLAGLDLPAVVRRQLVVLDADESSALESMIWPR